MQEHLDIVENPARQGQLYFVLIIHKVPAGTRELKAR